MTDKRKKRARALSKKTGMSHAAAVNVLNQGRPQSDLATKNGRLAAMARLVASMQPVLDNPDAHSVEHVQACHEDLAAIAEALSHELEAKTPPEHNFGYHNPNFPLHCQGCGRPLLMENLFVDDGCPCNAPRGVNFKPVPCTMCDMDDCVKPGHRTGELWGIPTKLDPLIYRTGRAPNTHVNLDVEASTPRTTERSGGCDLCGGTRDNHYRVRAPGHENDDGDGAPTVPCPNASSTGRCTKCHQERDDLTTQSVWIEGEGLHFTPICGPCLKNISEATDRYMDEHGVPRRQPETVEPAPPFSPPEWEKGDYTPNEAELALWATTFRTRFATAIGQEPDAITVSPKRARKHVGQFEVTSAEVAVGGMNLTREQKVAARRILYTTRIDCHP